MAGLGRRLPAGQTVIFPHDDETTSRDLALGAGGGRANARRTGGMFTYPLARDAPAGVYGLFLTIVNLPLPSETVPR